MSKTITIDGKRYTVPDDATLDEVEAMLGPVKQLSGPELAQQQQTQDMAERNAPKPKPSYVPEKQPVKHGAVDPASVLNAAGSALAPYATVAGLGAAGGSVVPGVGTAAGATAGVTGLALGDLAATGYNLAAPMFGGQPMTTPSDAIRQQYQNVGLVKPVEDPMGRVVFNAFNTGASAIGGGEVMRMGGELLKKAPGVIGAVGNFFSTPVANASQFGAGLTGGAAQQTATEMGADPTTASVVGLVGSLPGGAMGGGKTSPAVPAPSAAQLGARTAKAYDTAHQQGVEWTPDTVDFMASKAVRDAIDPAHPDGAMPVSAVAPGVRDVLRGLTEAAATEGRMDSRNLDFWRQKLGQVIGTLGGAERAVALRIREGLDAIAGDPDYTINTVRGDVASTRAAAGAAQNAAKAAGSKAVLAETDLENATAAWKAKPTPENAAARAKATADHAAAVKAADDADEAAGLATSQYESRQRVMHAQDPDIKQAAADHEATVAREARLGDAADKAYDEHTLATENHMTAEDARDNAKAAFDKLAAKYGPDSNNIAVNRARAALRAAEAEANRLGTEVESTLKLYDRAAAKVDKAKLARVDSANKLRTREKALTPADDTQARVNGRNEALADARATFPVQKNTKALEAMPEAANVSPAGASGDMAAALRQQVRAFIRDQGPAAMHQLPEATRRALEHFAAGGRIGQRTLELIGRLSPGSGGRHAIGNATTAALSAVGAIFGGGAPGAIALPLASAAATTAARSGANRMAENEFARVRDLVARGNSAKPKPPTNTGKKVLNFMLADQLTTDPKR